MTHGQFEIGDQVVLRDLARLGRVIGRCPVDGWPRVEWRFCVDTFVKPDCLRLATLEELPSTRKKQTA